MEHKTKSAASEGRRSEPKTLRKFLSVALFPEIPLLVRRVPDVPHSELNLIQHNTHEYTSAKWLAD